MSWQAVTIGFDSKVEINGVPYASRGGQIMDKAETHDVTDTESADAATGEPRTRRKRGRGELELELNAQLAEDVSPHVSPLGLKAGGTVEFIEIWPHGKTQDSWKISNLLLDDDTTGFGDPATPNTIRVHGFTGDFTRPDE